MKNLIAFKTVSHKTNRNRMVSIKLLIFYFIISLVYNSSLFSQVNLSQEEDFFYSNGQKMQVLVSKNSIGLLAKDGITSKQILALSDSLQFRLNEELPGGIYVLSLEDTLTRLELVARARTTKFIGEQIIAQAGLIITPFGAETPMIGSDEFVVQYYPNVTDEQIKSLNESNGVEMLMENPFIEVSS